MIKALSIGSYFNWNAAAIRARKGFKTTIGTYIFSRNMLVSSPSCILLKFPSAWAVSYKEIYAFHLFDIYKFITKVFDGIHLFFLCKDR